MDRPTAQESRPALLLLRADGGAVEGAPVDVGSVDWPPERGWDSLRRTAMRVSSRAAAALGHAARFSAANYHIAAQHRTDEAFELLIGRLVCTDRLHGCILGLLAGTPLILVPESTGKLRSFHQTWLAEYEGATLAKDLRDGLERVAAMEPAKKVA